MGAGETAAAHVGGLWATRLRDVTSDVTALDGRGRWAVVLPYDGEPVCARFDSWDPGPAGRGLVGDWVGPAADAWSSSMDEPAYVAAVEQVRERIARGDVYQANVCRVMSARLPDPARADVLALHALLQTGNPAPYAAAVRVPSADIHVACASPELYLARDGDIVSSGPIKGTGRTAADLTAKDQAENVMIVDLVRNDLSAVAATGTVEVPSLLRVEEHPGLVHLVSTVSARLRPGVGWADLLAASFPPGSVTGAPKLSALSIIEEAEPAPRGVYCGAVGWVDADARTARLAVAIRTFWRDDDILRFGTGAGITWGSDARAEWDETRLKAARLVGLAAGAWQGGRS